MKKPLAIATVILLSALFNCQLMANSAFKVISSNSSQLIISTNINLLGWDTLKIDGKEYYKPKIQFADYNISKVGEPNIPTFSGTVIVPSASGAKITSIKALDVKKYSLDLAPTPKSYIDSVSYFFDSASYYSTGKSEFAELDYLGFGGFDQIAKLSLIPALYNSANRELQIPSKIIVEISFDNINIATAKTNAKNYNSALNSNMSGYWDMFANKKLKVKNANIFSSNSVLRLTIDKEGIYKLSASDLSANGISIASANMSKLKVFGLYNSAMPNTVPTQGDDKYNEIPLKVITNASGDFESIIFYAAPAKGVFIDDNKISSYNNPYASTQYYVLGLSESDGKRLNETTITSEPAVNTPDFYYSTIYNEEDLYNAFPLGSGLTWFGRQIDSYSPLTITNTLTNLKRTGNVLYILSMATGAGSGVRYQFSENSKTIGYMTLNADTEGTETEYSSATDIASGDLSVLKIATGQSSSICYIDKYIICYPSTLQAIDGSAAMITDNTLKGVTEYSINGFPSSDIYCFDVTNSDSIRLIANNSNVGGLFDFKTNLLKSNQRFFISSNFISPSISKITLAGLRDKEYTSTAILIYHPDLFASAVKYKEFRESNDSIKVELVSVEDIYNEFGYSMKDPSAIRNFVAKAYFASKGLVRYIILWGDGHYDYRNIQTQKTNYIIPFEIQSGFDDVASYPTDDYYSCVNGNDDIPELALGRIIVNSNADGYAYISKLDTYMHGSSAGEWRNSICMIADDSRGGEGDNDSFTKNSEALSKDYMPKSMLQSKIYLAEYPVEHVADGRRKPLATQQLVSTINNEGANIINWIGHGNPRVLAHEELFNRDKTLQLFSNRTKLFFFVGATCDFARYDNYNVQSGAECMLTYETGGAIATYTPSRSVYAPPNQLMEKAFYNALFNCDTNTGEYPRLGDAVAIAKQANGINDNNGQKYCLLGDPLLKLLLPQKKVSIDSINSISLSDTSQTPLIKALSDVTVSGKILNGAGAFDDTFNGVITLNVFDTDISYWAIDDGDVSHFITKYGGALNKGSYPVVNGVFTAKFTVPKDIEFSNKSGRIIALAVSDSGIYANGFTDKFIVGDINTTRVDDKQGPEIAIYMDSRKFKSGDVVRKDPLLIVDLYDETGVNATGSGIGHKIEAWLDDSASSIDLTSRYVSSTDNYLKGDCEKQLFDLKAGNHTIKVRAWDVFNNYSMTTTNFVVGGGFDAFNPYAYPNPTTDGACTIVAHHNQSAPITATLNIYNTFGQLIRSGSYSVSTNYSAEFYWDGKDNNGIPVSSGSYYYHVILGKDGFSDAKTSGLISVIK